MPSKKGRCKLHLNPPAVGGGFARHASDINRIVKKHLSPVDPNTSVELLYDLGLTAELTVSIDRQAAELEWRGRLAAALREIYENPDLHHPSADQIRLLFEPDHRDQLEIEDPEPEPQGPEQQGA